MGKRSFFPRLALVNLVRNSRYYGPYLLSCGALAAMYYILRFLTWNEVIQTVRGAAYLQVMMSIGCFVVALFSTVLLLYANSFVMKRRQKELGLYNILGLEKRHIAALCFWETLLCAAVVIPGGIAAGILLSRSLLTLMKTPDEVMADSVTYLQIYFGGVIFNALYNMAAGILNAAGNSRRSLLYLACASVTNIVLDLILVKSLDMGVAGAAIATDASQLVSCVLAMGFLMRVNADYRVRPGSIRINGRMAGRIIKIGLPAGIQNMVVSFSNAVVQSSVNGFGADAMAGFGAFLKIDGFSVLPVLSLSLAMTTFAGQNLGAGRVDRVKRGIRVTLVMGAVYTIVSGGLVLAFATPIIGLFTDNQAAVSYGVLAARYFCPFYIFLSVMHELAGTVRGAGKSIPPMVILLTSLCVLRIIWLKLLLPVYNSIDIVYASYPTTWAIGMLLMILYVWKSKWLTARNNL